MSVSEDLYERDGVAWAEQQAAALRRREAGHNQLDYENLAEEIEDVAKAYERACRSYIRPAVEHLVKLEFVPQPENYRGWRVSVTKGRNGLEEELTPTLRVRMPSELPDLHKRVLRSLRQEELVAAGAISALLARGGYTWDQITDPDWWPEPAGSVPPTAEQGQPEDERQA